MDDKEWDELKLIQEKLHEALDKGYPPLGTKYHIILKVQKK